LGTQENILRSKVGANIRVGQHASPSVSMSSAPARSWVRQSSEEEVSQGEDSSSVDLAVTQLTIMGLWMGRNCRGITNTTDSIFQQSNWFHSSQGQVRHGFSSSIAGADNTYILNSVSMARDPKSVTSIVYKRARNWGRKGRTQLRTSFENYAS
jgi:hypothetical protein